MNRFLSSIRIILFLCSLTVFNLSCGFASDLMEDQRLTAYIFKNNRDVYSSNEERNLEIKKVCLDPSVCLIDFSNLDLTDDDLDGLFNGLVEREKNSQLRPCPLQYINLESEKITEKGLKSFITKLQKGAKINGQKIFPDMRNTVVKIGFVLSYEFLEELQSSAPSVFAGHLRLVY